MSTLLEVALKRDQATSRTYRHDGRRFEVSALTPGAVYAVKDMGNFLKSREVLATTCDMALTEYLGKSL